MKCCPQLLQIRDLPMQLTDAPALPVQSGNWQAARPPKCLVKHELLQYFSLARIIDYHT
jgi:hypothetical protein